MYKNVIDVSTHQGVIDWKKVKEQGIEFVMLRAGYGKNNIDERFFDNATACTAYKIPFGIYWFSYAYTVDMAKREAEYAIAAVAKYKSKCPISFDLEYDTVKYAASKNVTIDKNLATKMAAAFCSAVRAAGYDAVNYTNKDYMNRVFDMQQLKEFDVWYARYMDKCDRLDIHMWQKSSSGSVSGIKGKVDLNISFKEYESVNKSGAATASGKPPQGTVLKRGASGTYVKWLQTKLNSKAKANLVVDGKFGSNTQKAVKQYQKLNGLKVDGKAGNNTNTHLAG